MARQASTIVTVSVPQHRIERASQDVIRRGLASFSWVMGAYYLFLTAFHVAFAEQGTWALLAGATALTAGFFLAMGGWFRDHRPLHGQAYPLALGVVVLVLANITLYHAVGNEPRNVINYALVNIVCGVAILSWPVLALALVLDAVAFAIAVQLAGTLEPLFDSAFLAGTWVLALGISFTRRRMLMNGEGLRLQAEIARDKAERRLEQRDRAIEAHRRSQEGLRRLIEASTQGVVIVQGGVIAYANQGFRDLVGRSRDEVFGAVLEEFVHPDDMDLADPELLRKEADMGVELRLLNAQGDPIALDVTAGQMEYGEGPATLMILRHEHSISETDRQELANRMLAVGTLAAGVAHEINNPLAYVIANLEMVQLELSDGDAGNVKGLIDTALEGAIRVRDIVTDLHSFSRPDEETVFPVEVTPVVQTSIRIVWNEIRHRAKLIREFGEEIPPVMGNPSRLGQVVLNLLLNAAHAIDDGHADANQIRVKIEAVNGMVLIEVSDTGQGMPESMLEQIWRPFFTTKPIGMGTGLGLSFVRTVVHEMGGEIGVESQVGKGTTFRILLPATTMTATPPPPRTAYPNPDTPPRRILLIDDEVPLAHALAAVLANDEVVIASTGQQALHAIADRKWDAVLCDIMMPEMPGPEVYRRIVAARPELEPRFAFITGGTFTEQSREFLESTTSPVLVKPFRAKAVRDLIEQLTQSD